MPEITKTQPLDSTAIRRLSRVAAVIFIDYLGSSPDWDLKMHSGSWTLQNIHIPEQVVK